MVLEGVWMCVWHVPAHRLGIRLEPPLPLAQRLHLPVGHGRALGRERGQHGRGPAAPPEEPAKGQPGRAGPPAARGAGAGAARLAAAQGQADGRGAGSAAGQGRGSGGRRWRDTGAGVDSLARGRGGEVGQLQEEKERGSSGPMAAGLHRLHQEEKLCSGREGPGATGRQGSAERQATASPAKPRLVSPSPAALTASLLSHSRDLPMESNRVIATGLGGSDRFSPAGLGCCRRHPCLIPYNHQLQFATLRM